MNIIIWEFILIGIIVTETIIGTFLGWRVLGLMKRVKDVQADRNKMDEERRKLSNSLREKGIEIDKLEKERPKFGTLEKKMILVALNRPNIKAEMEKSHASYSMKGTYENLKQKIRDSFDD